MIENIAFLIAGLILAVPIGFFGNKVMQKMVNKRIKKSITELKYQDEFINHFSKSVEHINYSFNITIRNLLYAIFYSVGSILVTLVLALLFIIFPFELRYEFPYVIITAVFLAGILSLLYKSIFFARSVRRLSNITDTAYLKFEKDNPILDKLYRKNIVK